MDYTSEPSDITLLEKKRLILETPFNVKSIISYGLIVYAKDTRRWVVTQRKHTVELLLIIRGLYRITCLPFLLACITSDEAIFLEKLLTEGLVNYKDIYINSLQLPEDELNYSLIRITESRKLILYMMKKMDLSKNTLSWSWPKGRPLFSSVRETPFDCGKREFVEEVGIELPIPLFVSDTYITQNIKTLSGRNVQSRYWIYIIPTEIIIPPAISHPEVSNRLWVNTKICKKLIKYDLLFDRVKDHIASVTS